MKPRSKKIGFTIIELLTVMSIIVVLIGILVPSMNAIRRYSKVVVQKNQFHDISNCLEAFNFEHGAYPDSSYADSNGDSYCGAMKLCEALVGQDGMGFHTDSVFDDKGERAGEELYYVRTNELSYPLTLEEEANLRARVKCLEGENVVQVASIPEIYRGDVGEFGNGGGWSVLCDAFKRSDLRRPSNNEKLGMPILYFRADTTQFSHEDDQMATNIYHYYDNHELLKILVPWNLAQHPLYDPNATPPPGNGGTRFYTTTTNPDVIAQWGGAGGNYPQPFKRDSFILISAGWDGLFGTDDDVFNFDKTKK